MSTKKKVIPAGLWLAFGIADPDRFRALEKKYGSLGSGKAGSYSYMDYAYTFSIAMEYFQHLDLLDTWDKRIADNQKVDQSAMREFDTVGLSLRDALNEALQRLKLTTALTWEDDGLRYKERPVNLAGEIICQLIGEIRKPNTWRLCDHCGIPFPNERRGAVKYCNANCRVLAYKKRKREELNKA